MSKKFKLKNEPEGDDLYAEIYSKNNNKYYGLFMARHQIEGLNYKQNNFIFRKFWKNGNVAAFLIKGADKIENYTEKVDLLGFSEFSVSDYDSLDFPVHVELINNRGVALLPRRPKNGYLVDKDVVIGWAQASHREVKEIVEFYLKRITDIEVVIKTNLNAHRNPLIFGTGSTSEYKTAAMKDKILNGDGAVVLGNDEMDLLPKALSTGAPYNIDKLYAYKQSLENELLTYLGVDNLGSMEKRERLINAEVESNADITESCGDNFGDEIEKFCKRVRDVLGFNIRYKKQEPAEPQEPEQKEETEEGGDDNEEV